MSFNENKNSLAPVSCTAAFFRDTQLICLYSSQEKQLLTTFHQPEKRVVTFWKVNPGVWFLVDEFL